MTTADEVLDRILVSHCIHCGVKLPESGVQCPSCNGLPPVLRGEAIEMLSQPGELSKEQAREAMGDAETAMKAFMDKAKRIDYWTTTSQLEKVESQINDDLVSARETLKTAVSRFKKAKSAENKARPLFEDAEKAAKEASAHVVASVRLKAGVEVETVARQREIAASEVLIRYRRDHQAAVAELETATKLHAHAEGEVRMLEDGLTRAATLKNQLGDMNLEYSMTRLRLLAKPIISVAMELMEDASSPRPERGDELSALMGIVYMLAGSTGVLDTAAHAAADSAVSEVTSVFNRANAVRFAPQQIGQ